MLSDSFNYFFTKLDSVHKYNAKRKQRNEIFQFCIFSELQKNSTSYLFKYVEKCSYETAIFSVKKTFQIQYCLKLGYCYHTNKLQQIAIFVFFVIPNLYKTNRLSY